MVDFISNAFGSRVGGAQQPRPATRRNNNSRDVRDHLPDRAELNFIPEPDFLDALIARARNALAKGFYWDRGSILNVLL